MVTCKPRRLTNCVSIVIKYYDFQRNKKRTTVQRALAPLPLTKVMATGSRLGLLVFAATALADTTSFPEIGSAGSQSTKPVNSNFGTMARARVPERPALIDAIREVSLFLSRSQWS